MKSWSFRVSESEAPQWHYAFSRFAESVSDFRPAFIRIHEDYRKGAIEQFSTQGAYGSGGWVGLSPRYAEWKEEHRPGAPLLVFSGLLRNAVINPQVEMTADKMTFTIDDSGTYGIFTKTKGPVTRRKPAVARFHQEGAGRLPVRKVVQLPESQIVRWRKIFQSFLVQESRRIG